MKNFLVFEGSWARIADRLAPAEGVQPVLLHHDGTLSLRGELIEEVPIHAAWLDFEGGSGAVRQGLRAVLASETLEFVQTVAAGLDDRLFASLAAKPIRLCNSDAQAPSIADFVLASILNRLHRFDLRAEAQQDHRWQRHQFRELGDCRCLLVGYGHIGLGIAQRLRAFGAPLTVVRRDRTPIDGIDRVGTLEELSEMLPEADIVVMAAALNEATRDLFDADMLARFKPGSIFVNIGRGAMVDEPALLARLDAGHIDYAVLDVFREEPLPDDHRFWDHPRVQVSAHTSAMGSLRERRGDDLLVQNLLSYLHGRPLRNEVDLQELRNA